MSSPPPRERPAPAEDGPNTQAITTDPRRPAPATVAESRPHDALFLAHRAQLVTAIADDPHLENDTTRNHLITLGRLYAERDALSSPFARHLADRYGGRLPVAGIADRAYDEYKKLVAREHANEIRALERLETQPRLIDQLLTVPGLADTPTVTALVDGWIYRDTIAEIYGAPGTFKSFIVQSMALAGAGNLGRWAGHAIPQPFATLYIAAEGVSGLRARVEGFLADQPDADRASIDEHLVFLPEAVQLGDPAQIDQVVAIVADRHIDLVVFDTRARCTVGLEENSATDQGRAIAGADRIRAETGATVLTVHHATKNAGTARGSSAWQGAVWSELAVTYDDEARQATVRAAKHKDARSGHTLHLAPRVVQISADRMPDVDPFTRSSVVLDPATRTADISSADARVDELVSQMDDADVPLAWGRDRVKKTLALRAGNSLIERALRTRRERENRRSDLSRTDPIENLSPITGTDHE